MFNILSRLTRRNEKNRIARFRRGTTYPILNDFFVSCRDRETGMLKSQISMLKGTIKREEEKADDLELKSKMFSYGEFKAEDQEKTLRQLHRKVEEVFR